MSAQQEDFETAADESNDREAREQAIEGLEAANECDLLADLVRMDDLETEFREQALDRLATPQCKTTLDNVVDEGDLPADLQQQAESLLEDVPDVDPSR